MPFNNENQVDKLRLMIATATGLQCPASTAPLLPFLPAPFPSASAASPPFPGITLSCHTLSGHVYEAGLPGSPCIRAFTPRSKTPFLALPVSY